MLKTQIDVHEAFCIILREKHSLRKGKKKEDFSAEIENISDSQIQGLTTQINFYREVST